MPRHLPIHPIHHKHRAAAIGGLAVLLLVSTLAATAFAAPSSAWSREEQQFVYELNRARWNPAVFGLSPGATRPSAPLAVNPALGAAASAHSDEMARYDYFAHQSPVTGLWPNELARVYGYPLPRYWPGEANNIESIHFGQPTVTGALSSLLGSPGHRSHLMGEGWYGTHREIGVGVHLEERIWSIMTAVDESGRVFLTGVAFRDPNRNRLMDLGEGLSGVTVTAGNYTTVTNAAGGWSLAVPPGVYRITASGGRFRGVATALVTVGAYNVGVDFRSGRARPEVRAYQTCGGLQPTLLGTNGPDRLTGTPGDDVIQGLGGADQIDGAGGHDIICGGAGNDTLTGAGSATTVLRGGPGRDACSLAKRFIGCEAA